MLFYNINKKSPKVNLEEGLMRGLAPDGGLYFPDKFPQFSNKELKGLIGKTIQEIGYEVFKKWFASEIGDEDLKEIAEKALNFPIPLREVGPFKILEVFHGPTFAFKDIAARCLAQMMSYFLQKRSRVATVLVATSGDTGGACAQGFAGVKNVRLVVLFPKRRVSKLQTEQMSRVAENVVPVEVDGVFDDCQALVKKAFVDPELRPLNLTSSNSINIGRLIPQTIYYIYAYSQLPKDNLEFIVPSGNMGNVTAGLFAYKMGLPFNSFIIATNENDAAVHYYKTGQFKPQETVRTISTAMDVGNPSNFIRVLELFGHDWTKFKEIIKAVRIDTATTIATIKEVRTKYNYLLDPHTAVGFAAAKRIASSNRIPVIIATASPLKFASEIKKTTGIDVDDRRVMDRLLKRKQRKYELENNYEKFKKFLLNLP